MDELDPLTGDPIPKGTAQKPLEAATEAKPVLAGLTDDELRNLSREKLSAALQVIDPTLQPEQTRKLCAELMDRLDGKPAQSVQLDATVRAVTVNATIRFADDKIIEHEPQDMVTDQST